jgi:hemoglobin-like flavoprotein
MTSESIGRVRASYATLTGDDHALSRHFYAEMFRVSPDLRPLFPSDLEALQKHFDAAIALVIRNLHEYAALQQSLRDLGAQHVGWRARPADYLVARHALVTAVRTLSPEWNDTLEADWHAAITSIVVPMLEGAAVETAMSAERLALDLERASSAT